MVRRFSSLPLAPTSHILSSAQLSHGISITVLGASTPIRPLQLPTQGRLILPSIMVVAFFLNPSKLICREMKNILLVHRSKLNCFFNSLLFSFQKNNIISLSKIYNLYL